MLRVSMPFAGCAFALWFALWFALSLALSLALSGCSGDANPAGPRGAVCAADADCGELVCSAKLERSPKDLAALPLACADGTAHTDQGKACEKAGDCARGICLLAGACARPCASERDCGTDERCQAVFARASAAALETLDACVAMISLPKGALADVELRKGALEIGSVQVELGPAQTQGTTLYVLEHLNGHWPGSDCRPPLCVDELRTRDPDPTLLFSAAADYAQAEPPLNPIATGDHIDPVVIMLPSGARGALSPAGYSVTLRAETRGDLRVTRLARSSPGQRLDLNVFYLGGLDWTPQGERGPPLLADALDVLDQILGQADIFVGDVRQIVVPGELPARGTAFANGDTAQGFAVLQVRFGVYLELPGLLRLSAGAANSAINLFFLKDIQPLSSDGEPEAEAGGIPGPLGMQGTSGSGIAIATDMMAGDAPTLGRTLAHEIGHYLGLFHTSEADGRVLDALPDTPECRNDKDSDGNGLDVQECNGFGSDNLMFWAKTTGTMLTPDQQTVLRSALILQ